jgi:hypothetical protein
MADTAEIAPTIGRQLAELQRQASAADMPTLAYLIEMAGWEAASQAGDHPARAMEAPSHE